MPDSPWLAAVREVLAPFRQKHFVLDEDCWYTCPAATDERDGGHTCNSEKPPGVCDCAADDDNAKLDAAMARLARGLDTLNCFACTNPEATLEQRLRAFREASAR